MANGSGVSVGKLTDGRFRVRWRERVDHDGERKSVQRERVVHSEQAMIELRTAVLRAIETDGAYVDPSIRTVTAPSIESIAIGYLRERASYGVEPRTVQSEAQRLRSSLVYVRQIVGLAPLAPVPASVMTRSVIVEVVRLARAAGLAETSLRHMARILLQVWTWGSDTSETPGAIPAPPRSIVGLLPRTPPKSAPEAPTLAEADACLRQLKGRSSRRPLATAILMRWTGLRVGQVLGAKREDLDIDAGTLRVRIGKSAREKVDQRVIPVSRHLIADILPFLGEDPDGSLIARRSDFAGGVTNGSSRPDDALRRAWKSATAAGEARKSVWWPTGRKIARPDHAFRAAFQHALVVADVRDEVIDLLVGHSGRSTRSKHYVAADARMAAMRAAIDAMPPIDWAGPAKTGVPDNVIAMKQAL